MLKKVMYGNRNPVSRAVIGLIFNLIFAFYNGIIGIINGSVWFVVSFLYYLLLGVMHFFAVLFSKNNRFKNSDYVCKLTGILLIVLSQIMAAVLYICVKDDVATKYGTITMITIATYTFSKITAAIIMGVRKKNKDTAIRKAIRNIRYSEVAISVFTMQQSMLVSFGSSNKLKADIFNTFTGLAVMVFILILGINLLISNKKEKALWQNQR